MVQRIIPVDQVVAFLGGFGERTVAVILNAALESRLLRIQSSLFDAFLGDFKKVEAVNDSGLDQVDFLDRIATAYGYAGGEGQARNPGAYPAAETCARTVNVRSADSPIDMTADCTMLPPSRTDFRRRLFLLSPVFGCPLKLRLHAAAPALGRPRADINSVSTR